MFRPLSRSAIALDIVGALLLFAVLTPFSLTALAQPAIGEFAIAAMVVAAVLQCGAVAVGRVSPTLALAVAWVGAIIQMVAGLPPLPINLAILGALFATAAWGTTLIFWAGLASVFVGGIVASVYSVFIAGMFTAQVVASVPVIFLITFSYTSVLAAPWLGGFGWRMVLRWRTSREAQSKAELSAAEEHERVRIARDMHDVVAHSLAVIVAQSDGARYAAAADPNVATEALGTIAQTARAALSDVRMLLSQLRHRQGDGPQPTIADLEQLYAQVRAAGVEPRVSVDPVPPGEPPAAIQLAVYRILQEALTNALRHGSGRSVDVSLQWHADRVVLEVRNAVAAAQEASSAGYGIVGMRERAQLVGGTLTTEREGGVFVVRSELPVAAVDS